MKILVLNGSPRPKGNTAAIIEAFVKGAAHNGHDITVVPVCSKHISGCKACEYVIQKARGDAYSRMICRKYIRFLMRLK